MSAIWGQRSRKLYKVGGTLEMRIKQHLKPLDLCLNHNRTCAGELLYGFLSSQISVLRCVHYPLSVVCVRCVDRYVVLIEGEGVQVREVGEGEGIIREFVVV